MIVLENGRVLDPASGTDAVRTVVIDGDRIVSIAEGARRPAGARVVDCRGKWIVPGFIDLHVHLREPGEEYKETIETGSRAAVAAPTSPPLDCMTRTPPGTTAASARRWRSMSGAT